MHTPQNGFVFPLGRNRMTISPSLRVSAIALDQDSSLLMPISAIRVARLRLCFDLWDDYTDRQIYQVCTSHPLGLYGPLPPASEAEHIVPHGDTPYDTSPWDTTWAGTKGGPTTISGRHRLRKTYLRHSSKARLIRESLGVHERQSKRLSYLKLDRAFVRDTQANPPEG